MGPPGAQLAQPRYLCVGLVCRSCSLQRDRRLPLLVKLVVKSLRRRDGLAQVQGLGLGPKVMEADFMLTLRFKPPLQIVLCDAKTD
jgi:hypothetical protein